MPGIKGRKKKRQENEHVIRVDNGRAFRDDKDAVSMKS
jgi:hypothetical protein